MIDGNVITGGGVTAGIDFALRVVAEVAGEDVAKTIQLSIEYDPQQPYDAGSPKSAGETIVARQKQAGANGQAVREAAVRASAARLHQPVGRAASACRASGCAGSVFALRLDQAWHRRLAGWRIARSRSQCTCQMVGQAGNRD